MTLPHFWKHSLSCIQQPQKKNLEFISAPIMAPENYWIFNPYSYGVRGVVPITKIHPNGIVLENTSELLNTHTIIVAILLALICFAIFTLVTSFIFSQREGN